MPLPTAERDRHRRALRDRLGDDAVLTGDADMAGYCRDWSGDVTGSALAVLRPGSTGAVASAVRTCRELGLAIVPQGGNTGLVLGAMPDEPERQVILNLDRMNRVRGIDPDNFSGVFDAGCILSDIKDAVAETGLYFPLALGAQGSCQIGGNVSTNAGGVNVLRYGMTRELILGIEVVLPDGSVLDGLNVLRKDNRGIDLKQIFIGAEGTLGVVTAVAIKLMPTPDQTATALLAVGSLDDAIALYRRARRECCDLMSAFEFMPPLAFSLAREAMPSLTMPLAGEYPAYVLMEVAGSGLVDIADLANRFLEGVIADGLVLDAVVASSHAQARTIWQFREGMVEGQALRGRHMRSDVSVPLSDLAAFVRDAEQAVAEALPGWTSVSYGHVGDGNVHLNVLPPPDIGDEGRAAGIKTAKDAVNAAVDLHLGSISAEHGIGRAKRQDFETRLGPAQLRVLAALKRAIDPDMTMNPGCQLRPADLA